MPPPQDGQYLHHRRRDRRRAPYRHQALQRQGLLARPEDRPAPFPGRAFLVQRPSAAHVRHRHGASARRAGAPLRSAAAAGIFFSPNGWTAPLSNELFADASVADEVRREVAERLAKLLHKLYLLGIEHGDLKADNLKIVDRGAWLLDLDALRQYRHARSGRYRRRHARDLRRFLQNWQDAPPVRALLESALRRVYGRIRCCGGPACRSSRKK